MFYNLFLLFWIFYKMIDRKMFPSICYIFFTVSFRFMVLSERKRFKSESFGLKSILVELGFLSLSTFWAVPSIWAVPNWKWTVFKVNELKIRTISIGDVVVPHFIGDLNDFITIKDRCKNKPSWTIIRNGHPEI